MIECGLAAGGLPAYLFPPSSPFVIRKREEKNVAWSLSRGRWTVRSRLSPLSLFAVIMRKGSSMSPRRSGWARRSWRCSRSGNGPPFFSPSSFFFFLAVSPSSKER